MSASSGAAAMAPRPRCGCCAGVAAPIASPRVSPGSAATCCITPCWRAARGCCPTPQRFRAAANWLALVRQGVLDGALISGLELLPLGPLPLPPAGRPRLAALPADWQEHPVLRHTARELGRMGGSQQLEG